MVEEDFLLDVQIKKKKRLVLLALLSLLLVTTLATLPWLQQPSSPATAIAARESPSPTSTAVSGVIPEPKTPPVNPKTAIPSALTPALPSIDQATSPPELTTNPTLKATASAKPTEPSDIATSVTTTPSLEAANRKTPTVTKTPTEVRGDEWRGVNTPPASASVQSASVEATKESPRYDGPEIPDPTITSPLTENEDNPAASITPSLHLGPDQTTVTITVVANHDSTSGIDESPGRATGEPRVNPIHSGEGPIPTSILTSSTLLTDTSGIAPPDGLPITGKNLPHQLNWASVGMLVLLLGAGVAALLRSEVEQK